MYCINDVLVFVRRERERLRQTKLEIEWGYISNPPFVFVPVFGVTLTCSWSLRIIMQIEQQGSMTKAASLNEKLKVENTVTLFSLFSSN